MDRPDSKRHPPGSLTDRYRDWRYKRRIHRFLRRALTPPPPSAFGAFGRSMIVPPARITLQECLHIGDGVLIHEGVWFSIVRAYEGKEPRVEIHDGVRIGRFCQISSVGAIVIEEDALISDHVHIADTYHGYEDPEVPPIKQSLAPPRPVRIERGALLNLGVVILPGVTVGASACVEAGSVVTGDVPPGATVAGNPARIVDPVSKSGRTPTLR